MSPWPRIDYVGWRDTATTLHLWTQIVGKIRLALTPWVNHGWQVPLYVTARGLGTSPIPIADDLLEIEFDFLAHQLSFRTSRGDVEAMALEPRTVADFYHEVMATLAKLHVEVAFSLLPNEVERPIRFPDDVVHASYDAAAAHRFWLALVQADRVFKLFRTGFLGKASPEHFFWGSFDLAATRFSGRRAPCHPGVPGLPDAVTREAYSHEEFSMGFWPGDARLPAASFYAYAYPEPPGFDSATVIPPARFDEALGEFVLPYDAVREAADPDALLLAFLQSTYEAAADRGGWDREALECAPGGPGVPRPL